IDPRLRAGKLPSRVATFDSTSAPATRHEYVNTSTSTRVRQYQSRPGAVMGVRRDLKRARQRTDLADRTRVEIVRDEHGVVREARTPALAPGPAAGSIADLPFTNAAEAPDAVILRRREAAGWRPLTAAAFARDVTDVAKGLIAAGLEPGG